MTRRGQSLVEYVVFIAAVSLGVMLAANAAYKAFIGQSQGIERHEMVF